MSNLGPPGPSVTSHTFCGEFGNHRGIFAFESDTSQKGFRADTVSSLYEGWSLSMSAPSCPAHGVRCLLITRSLSQGQPAEGCCPKHHRASYSKGARFLSGCGSWPGTWWHPVHLSEMHLLEAPVAGRAQAPVCLAVSQETDRCITGSVVLWQVWCSQLSPSCR